jgi:hypothetical protein
MAFFIAVKKSVIMNTKENIISNAMNPSLSPSLLTERGSLPD